MIILVFNAGSSSLKYKLFDSVDADNMTTLAQGMVEAIGTDHAKLKVDGEFIDVEAPTTEDALKIVIDTIAGPGKPLASMEEVEAIGHRVAHGGAYFNCSTRIDHDVVELIESVEAQVTDCFTKEVFAFCYLCRSVFLFCDHQVVSSPLRHF